MEASILSKNLWKYHKWHFDRRDASIGEFSVWENCVKCCIYTVCLKCVSDWNESRQNKNFGGAINFYYCTSHRISSNNQVKNARELWLNTAQKYWWQWSKWWNESDVSFYLTSSIMAANCHLTKRFGSRLCHNNDGVYLYAL